MTNIAILGIGRMGMEHANEISKYKDLNVSDVSSRSKELLKDAKQKFNNVNIFEDHLELIKKTKADWIIIANKTNEHVRWAKEAINNNKNLIIEKPISLNYNDAYEIFDLADKKKLKITVHQNRRWDNDFKLVRNLINNNSLGKVYRIESKYADYSQIWGGWGAQGMNNPWRLKKEEGGGLLNDWACHLIDQIILIDFNIKSVYGKMHNIFAKDVDDHFWVELQSGNDLSIRVEASHNYRFPHPRWYVAGKEGTLQVCGGNPRQWNEAVVLTEENGISKKITYDITQKELSTGFYPDFINAINNKKNFEVRPEHVLKVMKIIDALKESDQKNKVIEI